MMSDDPNPELMTRILCHLERFSPIKVDEQELVEQISTNEKVEPSVCVEELERLVADGYIAVLEVQPPFEKQIKRRFSLTEKGKEWLDQHPSKSSTECISPREIESRLISTYDSMKGEMESIRRNLEKTQRTLEVEMGGMRKSMTEHDQFLRTYMIRIIESIGMFIGIFGIVVVIMVQSLKGGIFGATNIDTFLLFVLALPFLLIVTIIPGLWLIKRIILEPGPSR
jgi:DNA-binding PadR family transcriptional regulator